MRENLCEIRNCRNEYPKSNFKLFMGGIKITECPVSFITPFSRNAINQYLRLREMKELGATWDLNLCSNKEIEAFMHIKSEIRKIEEQEEKKNKR